MPNRHVRLALQLSTRPTLVETLESRILLAADFYSVTGVGNNLLHTTWGSAGTALIRLASAQYADGISAPSGSSRPSPRAISNAVADGGGEEINSSTGLSAFAYLWGQFVDHDLDLTTTASANGVMNIAVPTGDPSFDPLSTGTQVMSMSRSNYLDGTGVTGPRQQVTDITSFLDGSMIYGSDAARAAALRTFSGGKLRTSDGNLLPFNTSGQANANDAHIVADDQLFLAGDVRANENSELTSLQTLFVREHNRLATQIGSQHRNWSDEQIFQQARRLVIAEIQNITYTEFLPALLGPNALPAYTGYKPNVNPGISTEFSTAAFRLGHSMLTDDVEFLNNDGSVARPEMSLSQVFFNPNVIEQTGIDPILKYLASSNSQEIDTKVVDSVRNFLFGPPGAGGLDLASLNIERGRDHGLADYNTTRAALGLPKVTSFSQITSDAQLAGKLEQLYGNVDNVDLWVGGLAEDHLPGSNVGATFQKILVDQFTRTRDGDRLWYERTLSSADLKMIRRTTLADVVSANSTISNLQRDVFHFNVRVSGQVFTDSNGNGRLDRFETGRSGITVELVDDSGAVVASTVSGRNGNYHFDNVQVGSFVIRAVVSATSGLTTTPVDIAVTRGGDISNTDIALQSDASSPVTKRPIDSTFASFLKRRLA